LDFVRDYRGEPAPERQKREDKTNLDLLEQEIVNGRKAERNKLLSIGSVLNGSN